MDLALEFGVPFEALNSEMTEREYGAWRRYAAKWLLPTQRICLHLAQLAYYTARSAGVLGERELEDFIIPHPSRIEKPESADDFTVDEVHDAFDFRPAAKNAPRKG